MKNKIEKIIRLMTSENLDAVALIPSPNFSWLTGMDKHLMERPTIVFVTRKGEIGVIAAQFEMNSFNAMMLPYHPFPFKDTPSEWGNTFTTALNSLQIQGKKIGVEPLHFRFLETEYLTNAGKNIDIVNAERVFKPLRLHKTTEELTKMRQAARIAERALEETLKMVHIGITEREIAAELSAQLMRAGSQPEFPFPPIVASGPNAADPHARPGERAIQSGDLLLFDWGARFQGYCSDITRTFGIGQVGEMQRTAFETVLKANRAAFHAAKPGVTCGSLDKAARDVITQAGFGDFFTHRLGHGLGMEAHEDPYMFGANEQILEPGMVFTDEPGIYIKDQFGIRIEDDLAVTEDRCEALSTIPREWRTLCD